MLRGKIFEKNEEIRIGGQICPLPVCLGLILKSKIFIKMFSKEQKIWIVENNSLSSTDLRRKLDLFLFCSLQTPCL